MLYLRLKSSIAFFLLCFIIVFTYGSCISAKRPSYIVDGQVWEEIIWKEDWPEELTIQWKFSKGKRAIYQETQNATVFSEAKVTEQEHSLILEYHIKDVSNDGTAQVILHGKDLVSKGTGYKLFQFLLGSSSELGGFSITPFGQMTNVEGLIDIRSLPTFPGIPLKIGSRWTGVVSLAFAPTLPQTIATGDCDYQLIGLADVNGHKWAKISFEADVEQTKQKIVIEKIIGVKWAEKPDENGQNVVVTKVIPGTPAEKAGVFPGDVIVSAGNMSIHSWSDLASAISLSSCDKLIPMIVLRNKIRKKLMVKPMATLSGQMESKGNIAGIIIFDVTQGLLIRMQINPFIISSSFIVGDQKTEITAKVDSLTQLHKLQ